MLKDWYHNQSQVNPDRYLSKANADGDAPTPSKSLQQIQKIWRKKSSLDSYAILDPVIIINDGLPTNVKFEPGKTYLLRLFNFSGYKRFFEIVEADSVNRHDLKINTQ